jgi:hypothetical protein
MISPKWHSLSGRRHELRLEAVGAGFSATRLRAMELITILNRCYRFRGAVCQQRPLQRQQEEHRCGRMIAQWIGGRLLALPLARARLRPTPERRFAFILL